MKIRTRLIGTAGAALAFLVLVILLSPHQSQAQYATPVRVTNSASAPAIDSSVDEPGRIPYESVQSVLTQNCPSHAFCNFTFPAVPAGRRLVVLRLTGSFTLAPSPSAVSVLVGVFGNGAGTIFDAPALTNGLSVFDQPVLTYYDAGSIPLVQIQPVNTSFGTPTDSLSVILHGYLLDCSAAPCAPIAH